MIEQRPVTLRPARPPTPSGSPRCSPRRATRRPGSTIADRIERFTAADGQVIVAEDAGEILGFVAVHVMPRFEHDDTIARVLALVVDAGARGRGRRARPHGSRRSAIARDAGRRIHRGDRRAPSARGPPPLRGDGLRRDRYRVSPEAALTDSRGRGHVPAPPPPHRGAGPARAALGAPARGLAGRSSRVPRAAGRPVAPPRPVRARRWRGSTRSRRSRSRSPSASTRSSAGSRPTSCRRSRRSGWRSRPTGPRRSSSPRYLGALAPVPPPADAARIGLGALPRPAARRDGVAARRPPPGRRLLGRLLARQHPLPARRRQDPGLPRRRRDERGPPVAVGRPARLRPRGPRRERRLRAGRPGRLPGPAGRARRGRSPRPRASGRGTRALWDELHAEVQLGADDRFARRGPGPPAQRARLLRSTRSSSSPATGRAGSGCASR